MAVSMKVKSLTFDPSSKGFVLLLSDVEKKHELPIRIGPHGANFIVLRLKNVQLRRPTTVDLLRNILKVFDSEVIKVELTDFRDNTLYALIYIKCKEKEMTVDARPGDAIAIALTVSAPIYVNEEVFARAKEASSDLLEKWLGSLKPEDFKDRA
jgi:bifunctional DNase/RNase